MAAKTIHFSEDPCFSGAVLKNAGYRVEQCIDVPELSEMLDGSLPRGPR